MKILIEVIIVGFLRKIVNDFMKSFFIAKVLCLLWVFPLFAFDVASGKILKKYQHKVRSKIIRQWEISDKYLNEKEVLEKLKASLVVRINREGKIVSIEWEQKSGEVEFDRSCFEALQKVSSLPLPPKRLEEEVFAEGFLVEFNPSLKR